MRKFIKVDPPNPEDLRFRGNPLVWQRAMFEWAQQVMGKLESDSQQNDSPLAQPFVLGSYTLTTSLAGTSGAAATTNFLCTLVDAFTKKGNVTSKPLNNQ